MQHLGESLRTLGVSSNCRLIDQQLEIGAVLLHKAVMVVQEYDVIVVIASRLT
jgi:hypothetical protein